MSFDFLNFYRTFYSILVQLPCSLTVKSTMLSVLWGSWCGSSSFKSYVEYSFRYDNWYYSREKKITLIAGDFWSPNDSWSRVIGEDFPAATGCSWNMGAKIVGTRLTINTHSWTFKRWCKKFNTSIYCN